MKNYPEKQATAKPLYIFIGEVHDDFSNVSLVHQLLKSCKANGLKAAFYPEDDSQLEKMGRFTYEDGTCGAKNLPDNWKEIATEVDNDPARNKEMHLVGNRAQTVFDPFYVPIAGVDSDQGNFTGATGAFSEVIRRITDPAAEGFIGINPAFLPSINGKLDRIGQGYVRDPKDPMKEIKLAGLLDINDPENFGLYVKNTNPSFLLSSAIANRMVGEIKKHQADEDVVIILTGNLHAENVATKLGIPESEMILVSNCENELAKDGYLQGVGVIKFDVDVDTKCRPSHH